MRFPFPNCAPLLLASILLAIQTLAPAAADGPAPAGGGPPIGFYIAQFGHGVAGDLLLTTEVNVVNLEETSSQYRIRTYDSNGDPLAMLRQDSAGGSQAVQDQAGQVDGRGTVRAASFAPAGQLRTGWGLLTTDDAIGVEVIFNIFAAATGELLTSTNVRVGILQTQATFLGSNQVRRGASAAAAPQGAARRVRSGVALLNPLGNDAPARVELTVFDNAGQQLGQSTLRLNLGQRVSMFVDELVPGLPDFEGTVRLRSFDPNDPDRPILISVLPLRQENVVLTTQLAFPGVVFPAGEGPADRFFFSPQFGHGTPPGSNLLLTTEVYVLNLEAEEVSEFRIDTFDPEGNPLRALRGGSASSPQAVSVLTGEIPAGGAVRISSASDPGQVPQGWAVLRSNDFVVLEVVFNIFDATTGELLTSTNVAIFPIITAVSFFVFNETRDGPLDHTPSGVVRRVRSGVALVNPIFIPGVTEGTRAVASLFALDRSGVIIGETEVVLDPGQRVSMFVDEFVDDLPDDFTGTLELRSDDPLDIENSIPIGVLPLRQENVILTTQALFPPRVLRERR